MLLKNISLHNFRNYDSAKFAFNPFLTVVIGENAQGKTNLLESIYFLINGVGFRETKEMELLRFGVTSHAQVEGTFALGDIARTFKIVLVRSVNGTDTVIKSYFVQNSKKKHSIYAQEATRAILFTPQQIEILTGSPERRRDYFNKLIASYDFEYKKRLDNYEHALRKRNKVLERYREQSDLDKEIVFWNDYLEEQATYITQRRQEYMDFLNDNPKIEKKSFTIEYLKNEFTKKRLNDVRALEERVRKTMIGPQKDDFKIFLQEKDVHHFASRSEQRLTILWLKMNEIRYYEERIGKKPILLYDDVFSELDIKNKKLVLDLIKKYQSIVTTTEVEILGLIEVPKSIIKV